MFPGWPRQSRHPGSLADASRAWQLLELKESEGSERSETAGSKLTYESVCMCDKHTYRRGLPAPIARRVVPTCRRLARQKAVSFRQL